MRLSRRSLLAGGAALLAAGGALVLTGGFPAAIRAHFRDVFGEEIAAHPDTALFAEEFTHQLRAGGGKRDLLLVTYSRVKPRFMGPVWSHEREALQIAVEKFIQSSNVVRFHETGEDFAYDGLFDPPTTPCSNQMSVFWT